jgi:hypothetical protein
MRLFVQAWRDVAQLSQSDPVLQFMLREWESELSQRRRYKDRGTEKGLTGLGFGGRMQVL